MPRTQDSLSAVTLLRMSLLLSGWPKAEVMAGLDTIVFGDAPADHRHMYLPPIGRAGLARVVTLLRRLTGLEVPCERCLTMASFRARFLDEALPVGRLQQYCSKCRNRPCAVCAGPEEG